MITVAFFTEGGYTEKEYVDSEVGVIIANLDIYDHLSIGGFCSVERGNISILVTDKRQTGIQ